MNSIKSYTDTQCELKIAKERLNLLLDRKAQLYSKCFGLNINYGEKVSSGIVSKGFQDKIKRLDNPINEQKK